MYVVPRRDRRPFFAIVYSSLVDHSVPWAIHDKLFFLPGGGIPDRGLRLRSRGMIDDKVEDENSRTPALFYFLLYRWIRHTCQGHNDISEGTKNCLSSRGGSIIHEQPGIIFWSNNAERNEDYARWFFSICQYYRLDKCLSEVSVT